MFPLTTVLLEVPSLTGVKPVLFCFSPSNFPSFWKSIPRQKIMELVRRRIGEAAIWGASPASNFHNLIQKTAFLGSERNYDTPF
jgi:hypothetical protein